MKSIKQWMEDGEYLPKIIRDFHDQKDLFKTIHGKLDIPADHPAKKFTWMDGQCYVIDIFLWYMAKRGYTLQHTRRRGEFIDIEAEVEEYTSTQRKAFFNMLKVKTRDKR